MQWQINRHNKKQFRQQVIPVEVDLIQTFINYGRDCAPRDPGHVTEHRATEVGNWYQATGLRVLESQKSIFEGELSLFGK